MFRRFLSTCKETQGKVMFYPKYGTSLYEHSMWKEDRKPPNPPPPPPLLAECASAVWRGGSEVNVNHPNVKMDH